ncbi:hypothetical protein BMI86_13145 [Thioclava sp. DLFJ5-1]|uniref:AAA family ATPase n=1 Tax=Thioclava sp. DLFJ5-1 TaxID=1915314 RepID=UPI00099886C8|nr:AAA family ATPase [Thioclava sp. DLFJ5-1]OOY19581.1 hypothetical protein BMI86_13145 [Thioclava sp. DLFJ5-1]
MTKQNSSFLPCLRNIEAIHAPSFAPDMKRDYVVKNLFNSKEVSMIIGAPGLGKTAIVAAIAAHASLGRDFGGFYAKESCVLYFAAEDSYGVLCRAHPYLAEPAYGSAPFYVMPFAPDLTERRIVDEIIAEAQNLMTKHGMTRILIVFDTMNRVIGGNDENSAAVMGLVLQHAAEIAAATNGAVVFVHHVGNGDGGRPRGSTALEGNVDGLYVLTKADNDAKLVLLRPRKSKNSKQIDPVAFRIEAHHTGTDEDGDAVFVPKAVPQGDAGTAPAISAANINAAPSHDGNAERAADLLRVLTDTELKTPGVWLAAPAIADRSGSAFRSARNNRDSLLKAVRRALAALLEDGKIEKGPEGFRLAPSAITASADHTA